MTSHVLYRMFDADGCLLYVGITNNPKGRIYGHQADKPWWPTVCNITLEHLPNRVALEAAEQAAIGSESPRFNAAHAMYTAAWCQAEGHVPPGRRKCQDCVELGIQAENQRQNALLDIHLQEEYGSSPFVRSMLGLDPPPGERNLTVEELQAHPALRRFGEMRSPAAEPRSA